MSKMDIKPTIPTWIKTNIKVSFRDNNGIIHRGVLTLKSLHKWSLIIRKSKRVAQILEFSTTDISNLHNNGRLFPGHQHLLSDAPSPTTNEIDQPIPKPKLRTHDNPVSSLPNDVSFTVDQLQRRFGFRNISNILHQIRETSQPNYSISTLDQVPIIDLGNTSTIIKSKRNTTLIKLQTKFGKVVHMDILYGSATAHGQIKYALYLVDRTTRYKAIYPI